MVSFSDLTFVYDLPDAQEAYGMYTQDGSPTGTFRSVLVGRSRQELSSRA